MYRLEQLMVLDIETVSSSKLFNDLPPIWQQLWIEKYSKTTLAELSPEESYSQRAAITAEFGKVICITTGFFYTDADSKLHLKLKTVANDDEKILLNDFINLCDRFRQKHNPFFFAGHNIKEFDIPYIARRMMHHKISLPDYFQLYGKRPWETNLIDTLELWKFGDYKNYTSLKLLSAFLGIPTSKDDMDGSMVGK
ncbi:MAG: 3'-5' exonuclease, partial [Bacteroidota bacterium]